MDKLKLVKVTVFILTFLLVFGTLALLGSIYKKTRQQTPSSMVNLNLQEPQGSEIANFQANDNQIHILVKKGGLSDRIIVYDKQLQRPTYKINLQ